MSYRRKVTAKQFPPIQVAAFRKKLVAYYSHALITPSHTQNITRLFADEDNLFSEGVETSRKELAIARAAQLYWVSTDITAQVMDGSQDVPTISTADVPAESGILFFETPLPPLPMNETLNNVFLLQMALAARVGSQTPQNLELNLVGIMWHKDTTGVEVTGFAHNPAYTSSTDGEQDPRVLLSSFTIPHGQPTVIETYAETTATEHKAFLALVSALWVMMKTPALASVADGDIATGTKHYRSPSDGSSYPAATGKVPPRRLVQVVDMRPMRHAVEPTTTEETGGRQRAKSPYKWVVRGHWRNQAVGKNRENRQLIWIASYLKGNPDGQLKTTEKVLAWRTNTDKNSRNHREGNFNE